MAHAIWKGSIGFGLVQIPVSLHSAEESKDLSFTLLDERDLSPVGYERINKRTGERVPWGSVVKGYEYDKDAYVVLGDEDFRRANVEATQTVDILAFVSAPEVEPIYFERPYYLAPDRRGQKAYALLREALRRTGKIGIASVVIRTRQHVAAVMVRGQVLVLQLLRFAHEIRSVDDLQLPGDELEALGVSKKELDMAERLIEGMVDEWRPGEYRDRYREDLLALIDRRVEAGQIREIAPEEKPAERAAPKVIDMMALLKESLEQRAKAGPAGRPRKVAAGAQEAAPSRKAARTRRAAR
ncbi:MAG: Ku protein [Deltaproteobacteria bacterium]|nr:Ku protein [Deltaproteobacteria bacterium]